MIDESWLVRKTTTADVEATFTPRTTQRWLDRWKNLTGQMEEGDELWEFRSPPETWNRLMGHAGYALMRAGKCVGTITTMLS